MMHINADLLHWFHKFSDKKTSSSGIKNENISNTKISGRIT